VPVPPFLGVGRRSKAKENVPQPLSAAEWATKIFGLKWQGVLYSEGLLAVGEVQGRQNGL
jgi:hypothetical protein